VPGEEDAAATLLVVDDEPQLLQLMVRVLERGSYRVLAAKDGDEAMSLLEAHQREIDLVLLDVILPPNGIDALLERLGERHGGVPVVLTSGDTLELSMRERLEACGGVFLRKPFLPRRLLQTVEDCLAVTRGALPGAAERG
jgi:two-component system OmpR family response regulator